jgi:hypothetical protein
VGTANAPLNHARATGEKPLMPSFVLVTMP